jgi:hypothetical protein
VRKSGELKKKGKMRAARLQELEEMAVRLLALARKLPPGRRIGGFRRTWPNAAFMLIWAM